MASSPPGVFGRIALAVMHHPRVTAAILFVVTAVALALGSQIKVDPNLLKLMPQDDPTTQAVLKLDQEEGGVNLVTIAVHGDDPAVLATFMRDLRDRMAQMPDVDYALYDVDPELTWRLGALALDVSELTLLRDRLRAALAMGPAATNPFIASRLLDLGPMSEKLKSQAAAGPLSGDPNLGRLIVRPKTSAHDVQFARRFMVDVYALLAQADAAAQGVEVVWVGGPYRHAYEDLEGISHDLTWTVGVSLVMVFGLVGFAFRDPRAILLIFLPLVLGNIWTLGYAQLTVGSLNTFTSFFTAILIGLGVDFSIHLYSRYREERAAGGELEEAVVRAWDKAGPPCLTAAITTMAGFLALWAAHFGGFVQLGTLLAGGVMLCLIAVVVGLPLLIVWRERRPRAVPLALNAAVRMDRPPVYRLAPLGLLVVALVGIASGAMLPRVEFEYDVSELRPEGGSYAELGQEQRELAVQSFPPVIVSYAYDAAMYADYDRLRAAMADGRLSMIDRVLGLPTLLPQDQPARVALLAEIGDLARDPNIIYLPPQVQLNLAEIAKRPARVLSAQDLPASVAHLMGATDGHHRLMLMPKGNMWDLRECSKLHDQLDELLPGADVAGQYLAMSALYRLVADDGPRVAGVALILVFGMCLLDLRSLRRAAGAIAALLVGMVIAGAGVALFRIKISLVNFVGIPILIGVGIDLIVHLLHRISDEGPGRVLHALTTTGWAAGLSALTTVFAFGSLLLASNEGVRSLGLVVVLGLSLVSVAGFIVVPLGWMTAWKVRGDLPESMKGDKR
jgi:uncharacterized protein